MRIIKLQAENFKRLKAVSITPTGSIVTITGRNGQGKSSVLDSLWAALGGTEALPKVPVREGASEAIIRLDLGDYVVTRKIKAKDGGEYTTSLTIETPDGVKAKSPQTLLNDLVGRFSSKNSFHLLSSDARALGTYLVSTGLNVPVGELAQAMGQQKQIVSKLVHRGEDLRDNAVADRIIRRVEEIYGVGA